MRDHAATFGGKIHRTVWSDVFTTTSSKKTENPDHDFALENYISTVKTILKVAPTVRRFLLKEPPPSKFGGDISSDGAKGDLLETTVGYVGGAVAYPAIKGAMYLAKTALPMFQALALMCIYIAIPFAVPFAVLKPSLLLFFTSAIFSLKFMTGLWALASLLDDKLIDYMYGEDAIHTGVWRHSRIWSFRSSRRRLILRCQSCGYGWSAALQDLRSLE